ncbi:GroES-like protein [Lepidopterella palustris CBS 459.81]|uniref:GroES-like protein n=1 Tax=Lepidopterella palustris CBS 459.81 TaxID=1314670 RepID=A0A8E2EKF0_9PEZI|nr:GroES-like protein [Lepidopterella palustris CBS 459.81]
MDALILDAPLKTATVQSIPIPVPASNELLVRVGAIALNPVDALYTFNPLGETGRVVGSDFAGIVEALGTDVPSLNPHMRVGQRVAGFLQGACSTNERSGAFAEYLTVSHDLVWRVQDSMSLPEAASVSLCALTAAQILYYRLGLPAPFPFEGSQDSDTSASSIEPQHPLTVFIYGASTSVGLNAAQLVHLSSSTSGTPISVFGAARPSHNSKLTAAPYSYTALVDYRNPDWPAQTRALTGGKGVDIALDCISEGPSVARVASTLAPKGKMAVVRSREGKAWEAAEGTLPSEPVYGAVWEGLGERVEYQGFVVPASPRARQFAVAFYQFLSESRNESVLCPSPIRCMPGGLERVVSDGFTLLGPGTMGQRVTDREEDWMKPVSGEKIIYKLETGRGSRS